MVTVVLCLLLLYLTSLTPSIFADELALVIGQSAALLVVPKVPLSDSPGSRPGANVVAERVHIYGLSRMKNIKRLSHSVLLKVSYLNSSLDLPNVEVCFHGNLSLAMGMCPQSRWQKLSKDTRAWKMSPFHHKVLDIRMANSSPEALEVTITEEFAAYRVVLLVLGIVLIMLAPILCQSLVFYYSSAMAVGIILVILIVLFQGMKMLPTGRQNSLAIFLYSLIVGVGSYLLHYLPQLLHMILAEIGINEDMYTPLAMSFLLFVSLAGAWLGFWVVRKLILSEDGSIDTAVSQFVAWSIQIVGAVMVLQCSLDPLLAAEALLSAILVILILRSASVPRSLRRIFRKLRKAGGRGHHKVRNHDSSPAVSKQSERFNNFQYSEDALLTPQSRWAIQASCYSSAKGVDKKRSLPSESETFYSTYHKTPERRNFSDEEYKAFTKDCTKKGLQDLVSSPDFSRWAMAHAERITLAPIEKEGSHTKGWRKWLFWFR